MKRFIGIVLSILVVFNGYSQYCVETLNDFSYIRINPACVHNQCPNYMVEQKNDSCLKTTKISICGDNYGHNIPVNAMVYPNVEEIDMSGISCIVSFNGIESFKNLKKLNVCFDHYSTLLAIPAYGFFNIENLYSVTTLKQIFIDSDMYLQRNLGFGFFINDAKFCQLSELQSIGFPSVYNPIWLFAKMPNLKEIYFRRMNDKVDYVDSIQNFLLVNAKADGCCPTYKSELFSNTFNGVNEWNNYSGDVIVKYKDGKIACRGVLKNGLPIGTWIYYDNKSDTYYEEYYEDGNLLLIRNHDVDCFFPFIQIEKKENVEKYMRIQRINHSINKEVYYKITLENGDIIIVWDDGKMRRIHCIDVNRHIRYFIQKDYERDSYIVGLGGENYMKYDVMYHSIYSISKGILNREYEDTTRVWTKEEQNALNMIHREQTYDSLQSIINIEIQKFNFK